MGGMLTACAQKESDENVNQTQNEQTTMDKMNITIDGVTQTATFADTPAAKALAEKLKDGDFNLTLNTNGDFEIWATCARYPLPTNNTAHSPATLCSTASSTSASCTVLTPTVTPVWAALRAISRKANSARSSRLASGM